VKTIELNRSIKSAESGSTTVTAAIGIFDGFHRGHKKILKSLTTFKPNCVLTFYTHPRKVNLLTPFSERLRILKTFGVQRACVFMKSDDILRLTAEEFVHKILKELNVTRVIVGSDFKLGHDRMTDALSFVKICSNNDIDVELIDVVLDHGKKLSSSDVRNLILKGDVERSNELLGHDFYINGIVAKGKGIGVKLGFRTANVVPRSHQVIPSNGVYLTSTVVDGHRHKSFTYIGTSPTTNIGNKIIIETHIPGIEMSFYGKNMKILFVKRLRDEVRFNSYEELIKAIDNDINS